MTWHNAYIFNSCCNNCKRQQWICHLLLQSDRDQFLSGKYALVRLISVEMEVGKSLQFMQSSKICQCAFFQCKLFKGERNGKKTQTQSNFRLERQYLPMSLESEIAFPFEIFLPELKLILKGKKMITEVKKNIQKLLKLAELKKNRNSKQKYCEMLQCIEKTMV